MAETIFVTAAKGGAGATTCVYRLAKALSENGDRVLIVDGDAECGDALAMCGLEGLNTYTLADAEKGACRVKQAVLQHRKNVNLYVLPTLGLTDFNYINYAVESVSPLFDYIILDDCAPSAARRCLLVCKPYAPYLKSADKKAARLKDGWFKQVGLLINDVNGGLLFDGEIITPQEAAALLRCELWGVIPEDLGLPTGRINRATEKAFALTAAFAHGKSDKVYGVIKPYAGVLGTFKRKLRRFV